MKASALPVIFFVLWLIFHKGTGDQKKLEVVQPSFIKATAGDSVTISCFFKTDSPYFTVKWTLCCNPLESFLEHERYKGRVNLENNSLEVTIVNVTEKDSEKYCCRIQTADGEVGVGNGTLLNVAPHTKEVKEDSPCPLQTMCIWLEVARLAGFTIIIILLSIIIKKLP